MADRLEVYSVKDHFAGKDPSVKKTYAALLRVLRRFGPVREEAKKTSIHLVNASALAGVQTRKDYILLNVKADHRIKSPRIEKVEQVSSGRFHHKIRINSPDEIDKELAAWLKEAHELSR